MNYTRQRNAQHASCPGEGDPTYMLLRGSVGVCGAMVPTKGGIVELDEVPEGATTSATDTLPDDDDGAIRSEPSSMSFCLNACFSSASVCTPVSSRADVGRALGAGGSGNGGGGGVGRSGGGGGGPKLPGGGGAFGAGNVPKLSGAPPPTVAAERFFAGLTPLSIFGGCTKSGRCVFGIRGHVTTRNDKLTVLR